eukprot:1334369-Amorphochlora_amoeboformis.AAC.1
MTATEPMANSGRSRSEITAVPAEQMKIFGLRGLSGDPRDSAPRLGSRDTAALVSDPPQYSPARPYDPKVRSIFYGPRIPLTH